jgi:sensor domain CHASE-containing protein
LPEQGALRRTLNRLLPVGFAVVGIGLSTVLGHLDAQREQAEQVANLAARLSGVRGALEAQLRAAFSEAEGIAQLISADGSISVEHFHGMARDALASVPYMRHIALAPGDVVSDVYPLEGNERLLGLDYRLLPLQFPLLVSARDRQAPVLAGPLQLLQGGRGLIYRRPIFVTGKRGVKLYWGNLSVVADIDRLLLTAGLRPEAGFELAVRGSDGKGADGEVIWGMRSCSRRPR